MAMVEQDADHHALMVADGDASHAEHSSIDVLQAADCVIQWATSPQASLITVLIAAPTLGWTGGDLASGQITRPLAQANGPPHGDRQALLQVFRL